MLPLWLSWSSPPAMWEIWVQSLGWEDALERDRLTPVFWPGEFHGLYTPWGFAWINLFKFSKNPKASQVAEW